MRAPLASGIPIDATRIASWLGRFDGYRVAINSCRIADWLSNFEDQHRDIAARLLDAVTFLNSEGMEDALRWAVGRLSGWHPSKSRRQGKWRFVAFSMSAGESGDSMLHKTRTALRLSARRYDEIFVHKADLLREQLGPDDTVAFIDDFAGTGTQACQAWRTLEELLPGTPRTYLILVAASQRAVALIAQKTCMKVIAQHQLGPGDDIFHQACQHFVQQEKDVLLKYCNRADRKSPRGFGECGFVVVLAHRTPNNSIPVLHANHRGWVGLFPRD